MSIIFRNQFEIHINILLNISKELVKKLISGAQWNSAISVHPTGDNLIVAS